VLCGLFHRWRRLQDIEDRVFADPGVESTVESTGAARASCKVKTTRFCGECLDVAKKVGTKLPYYYQQTIAAYVPESFGGSQAPGDCATPWLKRLVTESSVYIFVVFIRTYENY